MLLGSFSIQWDASYEIIWNLKTLLSILIIYQLFLDLTIITVDLPFKIESSLSILILSPAALRLHKILWRSVLCDIETAPNRIQLIGSDFKEHLRNAICQV